MANQVFLMDCMEGMKQYPDKYFDLAVVDPPYGLSDKLVKGGLKAGRKVNNNKDCVKWDIKPESEYFDELFRICKNQIIWGGNYFILPPTRCNIIWDKIQEFTGADFELAWTSFDKASKSFRLSRVEAYTDGKIHPTQKPVKLYDWIYKNYLPEGGKVLDTHVGSGSSRIAAHKAGNIDFTGYEIDKEYWDGQEKRYQDFIKQLTLF